MIKNTGNLQQHILKILEAQRSIEIKEIISSIKGDNINSIKANVSRCLKILQKRGYITRLGKRIRLKDIPEKLTNDKVNTSSNKQQSYKLPIPEKLTHTKVNTSETDKLHTLLDSIKNIDWNWL